MAFISFKPQYLNTADAIYDKAQSNPYFNQEDYQNLSDQELGSSYLDVMAAYDAQTMTSKGMSMRDMSYLDSTDRFLYIQNKLSGDTGKTENIDGQEVNLWQAQNEYLNYKIQQAKDLEYYNNLSTAQKIFNHTVGFLDNIGYSLIQSLEGLIDFGALAVGAAGGVLGNKDLEERTKKFIAEDTLTSYHESAEEWLSKNTEFDRNGFLRVTRDIVSTAVPILATWGTATAGTAIGRATTKTVTKYLGKGLAKSAQKAYWAQMAGQFGQEYLRNNPAGDMMGAAAYAGIMTGIERATEGLSAIFGKSTSLDKALGIKTINATTGKLDGVGLALRKLGLNMGLEGLEEMVSEFVGSIAYKAMVDPTANLASLSDILYAGFIGAIIGGGMHGLTIGATQAKAIDKEGNIVNADKTNTELKNLTKTQTHELESFLDEINRNEEANNIQKAYEKAAKADTSIKSIEDFKGKYAEEYAAAQQKDTEIMQNVVQRSVALSELLSAIGVEQFTKSTEVLNDALKAQYEAIRTYASAQKQILTAETKKALEAWQKKNPDLAVEVSTSLNDDERALQRAFAGANIHVVFGKLGSKDGKAQPAIQLEQGTLIVQKDLTDTMSREQILEEVIKKTLTDNLATQLKSASKNNRVKLEVKKQYYQALNPTATDYFITQCVKDGKDLTDEQMQQICSGMLYNQLTADVVFHTSKNMFKRVINFLTGETRKNRLKKQGVYTQIKYHALMTCLNNYRMICDSLHLSDLPENFDLNESKNSFAFFTDGSFTVPKNDLTFDQYHFNAAKKTLDSNRTNTEGSYFDHNNYADDFVNSINPDHDKAYYDKYPTEFARDLNKYLDGTFHVMLDPASETLFYAVQYEKIFNFDLFDKDGMIKIPLKIIQGKPLSFFIKPEVLAKMSPELQEALNTFTVDIVRRKANYGVDGVTDLNKQVIIINTPLSTNVSADEVVETIRHEMNHVIMMTQGLDSGSSSAAMEKSIDTAITAIAGRNRSRTLLESPVSKVIDKLNITPEERQFVLGMEKIYNEFLDSGEYYFLYPNATEDLPEEASLSNIIDFSDAVAIYMYCHTSGEMASRSTNIIDYTPVTNAQYLQNTDFIRVIPEENGTRIVGKSIGTDRFNGINFILPDAIISSSEKITRAEDPNEQIIKNLTKEKINNMGAEELREIMSAIYHIELKAYDKYKKLIANKNSDTGDARKAYLEKLHTKQLLTDEEYDKYVKNINIVFSKANWHNLFKKERPKLNMLRKYVVKVYDEKGFKNTANVTIVEKTDYTVKELLKKIQQEDATIKTEDDLEKKYKKQYNAAKAYEHKLAVLREGWASPQSIESNIKNPTSYDETYMTENNEENSLAETLSGEDDTKFGYRKQQDINWNSYEEILQVLKLPTIRDSLKTMSFENLKHFIVLLEQYTNVENLAKEWTTRAEAILQKENITTEQYDNPNSVLEDELTEKETRYAKKTEESKARKKHIENVRKQIINLALRAYKPLILQHFNNILKKCTKFDTMNSVYNYINDRTHVAVGLLITVLGEADYTKIRNKINNAKNALQDKENVKTKEVTKKVEQSKKEEKVAEPKKEEKVAEKQSKDLKLKENEDGTFSIATEEKETSKKETVVTEKEKPVEKKTTKAIEEQPSGIVSIEKHVVIDGEKYTVKTYASGKKFYAKEKPPKEKEPVKSEKVEEPVKSEKTEKQVNKKEPTEREISKGAKKNIKNSKEYVEKVSADLAEYRAQVKAEKKARFSRSKDTKNNTVVTKDGTVRQQCVFAKEKGEWSIKGRYTEAYDVDMYEGTNFVDFTLTNKNGDIILNVENGEIIENNVPEDKKHDIDAFIAETYSNIYKPDVDLTHIPGYTKRIGDAINTDPEDYEKSEIQSQQKTSYPRLAYKAFIKKNKLVDGNGVPTLSDGDAEAFLTFLKSGNLQALSFNQQKNALKLCMFFVANANSFKKSIVKQINTMYDMIVSVSASTLGYWSGLFKREMTLDMIRDQFENMFGKKLVIDEKLEQQYLNARANDDFAKAIEYEKELLKTITAQLPEHKYNFLEKGLTMEERAKRFALLVGKINGFRYMAMLSNVSTHVLNYMSNAILTAQDILENKILGWLTEKADPYYQKYSQWKYVSKKAPVTKETREWVKQTFGGQIEYITRKGKYTSTPDDTLVDEALNQNQYTLKILQKWHDAIFNSLRESDRKFVAPRLEAMIAQIVQANWGNNFDQISDKDKQIIMENATNRVMLLYLRKEGNFTRIVNDLKARNPALNILLGAIIPFPKVIESTTIQILKHSPFGLARGLVRYFMLTKKGYTVDSTKKGLARFVKVEFDSKTGKPKNIDPFYLADTQEQIVQGATGTSFLILGAVLNLLGLLVFDDDDEYGGVVLKIGNVKIGLSTLAPSMTPIMMGAALGYTEQYPNLLDRVTRVFNDATLFGTFDSFFGNSSLGGFVAATTSNYFTQYVPSLFRAVSKMGVDQTKVSYNYNSIGGWFSTTWNRMLSSMPLINMTLPKKINPYTGKPYKYYNSTLFSIVNVILPAKLTYDTDTEISEESKRLGAATTGASGNFKINGEQYNLRGKDLEELQRNRGIAINDLLTEFYRDERVYSVIADGKERKLRYSQMTDEQRKTIVNRIYNNATEYSKALYWIKQGHSYTTSSRDTMIDIGNIFGVQVNYRKNKGTVYAE